MLIIINKNLMQITLYIENNNLFLWRNKLHLKDFKTKLFY